MIPSDVGVLLLGHGSHLSTESARPIHDLARALRAKGAFSEVRVAFWKEEPQLRHALDLVESRDVFVVPVFTSVGYFTDRIVPREMGLRGLLTVQDGRSIHLCAPLGTHRRMARIVLERAREAASLTLEETRKATLVVVGHGTDRHPASAETTLQVVERLGEEGLYGDVRAAFLDQEPRIEGVIDRIPSPHVVVVPFFISEGWHAGTTLPRDLDLSGGRTQRGDSIVWYGRSVGTHPEMAEVVYELVHDAWTAARGASDASEEAGPSGSPDGSKGDLAEGNRAEGASSQFAAGRAKRFFIEWICAGAPAPKEFLQTRVRQVGEDGFEIRHVDDIDRSPSSLRVMTDPEEAREVAALTREGRHRPLKTAPDLPGGWCFVGLNADEVWEVYTHLYPTAPVHSFQELRGEFRVTSFQETASRQTGMYEGVRGRTDLEVTALVRRCCSPERCLREPMWGLRPGDPPVSYESKEIPQIPSGGSVSEVRDEEVQRAWVPCGEPCTVFIAKARKDP